MNKLYEDITAPFTGGDLQNIRVLISRVHDFGVSVEEFMQMMAEEDARKRMLLDAEQTRRPLQSSRSKGFSDRCPVCGNAVLIMSVNQTKCTQVDGDYRYLEYCKDTACPHYKLYR